MAEKEIKREWSFGHRLKLSRQKTSERRAVEDQERGREYNEKETRFVSHYKLVKDLWQNLVTWMENTKVVYSSGIKVSEGFADAVGSGEGKEKKDAVSQSASRWFKANQAMNQEREAHEETLRKRVLEPLSEYLKSLKLVKDRRAERDALLRNYAYYANKVRKLKEKPDKDPSVLPRNESKMGVAKELYERLNGELIAFYDQVHAQRVAFLSPLLYEAIKVQNDVGKAYTTKMNDVAKILEKPAENGFDLKAKVKPLKVPEEYAVLKRGLRDAKSPKSPGSWGEGSDADLDPEASGSGLESPGSGDGKGKKGKKTPKKKKEKGEKGAGAASGSEGEEAAAASGSGAEEGEEEDGSDGGGAKADKAKKKGKGKGRAGSAPAVLPLQPLQPLPLQPLQALQPMQPLQAMQAGPAAPPSSAFANWGAFDAALAMGAPHGAPGAPHAAHPAAPWSAGYPQQQQQQQQPQQPQQQQAPAASPWGGASDGNPFAAGPEQNHHQQQQQAPASAPAHHQAFPHHAPLQPTTSGPAFFGQQPPQQPQQQQQQSAAPQWPHGPPHAPYPAPAPAPAPAHAAAPGSAYPSAPLSPSGAGAGGPHWPASPSAAAPPAAPPAPPAPPRLPPPRRPAERAQVNFAFVAEHDNELSIAVGEVISVLKKDGGWWEGELNGRRGLFPSNYVSLLA
eukprot:tig00021038_g17579.t1